MRARPSVAVYKGLVRCYPSDFRNDYGPDMVQLFAYQLADEPSVRVWARCLVDLVATIPAQHMKHTRESFVPLLFAAASVAAVAAVVVAGNTNTPGSGVAMVHLVLLVGAAVAATLAVVTWRRNRPLIESRPVTAHWWKFLVEGAGAIAVVIVGVEFTDLSMWALMMVTILFALAAIAAGLVLGIAHISRSLWSRPAASS